MTIVEFLRARYDEDQALATAAKTEIDGHGWHDTEGMCEAEIDFIPDPARVLREVEAKRRIVYEHTPRGKPEDGYGCPTCWVGAEDGYPAEHPCPTLRLMALPYDAHPDYDPSWSPT